VKTKFSSVQSANTVSPSHLIPPLDASHHRCIIAAGEKINWIKIAELIEGRSNKACRKRWIHSLNPTLRKGRWTLQEDELLLKAIRKHGHCWHKVAKYLPGRTDDQAAKRFREKLDPGIAKTPWSEEEDRVLLDMWKKVGCRWNLISRGRFSPFTACAVAFNTRTHVELNGRPAVHCRNRFASLKRIQKSLDPENQGETPLGAAPFVDPMNVLVSFLSLPNLPSDLSVVDSQPFDSLLESKQFSVFHPSPSTVTLFSLP